MFSPPPSPMPIPGASSSEKVAGFPFPRMDTAQAASRPPPDFRRPAGRRILLFVLLLPVALVLSASLRHLLRIPIPDDPPSIPFTKRDPQLPASGAPTPTSSVVAAQSSPVGPTTTAPPSVPSAPVLPTPLPQPFDLTLSSNFSTRSCESFFADFTQEDDFRQCRAFSFLLNSSSGFLDAQHNLTLFNTVLWATCNTPRSADECAATMSGYLARLNSDCHDDIDDGNPAALQAQIGFQSYTAMRTAACLKNPTSNTYCYVDAVAATSPADVYFYALPFGTPLPPRTKPSCSTCIKSVLAVYAQYVHASPGSVSIQAPGETDNSSTDAAPASPLPVLSKTYPAAARLAVNECGGTYASVSVATPSSGAPPPWRPRAPWSTALVALLALCVAP